jgi:hypothetical protein
MAVVSEGALSHADGGKPPKAAANVEAMLFVDPALLMMMISDQPV